MIQIDKITVLKDLYFKIDNIVRDSCFCSVSLPSFILISELVDFDECFPIVSPGSVLFRSPPADFLGVFDFDSSSICQVLFSSRIIIWWRN